MKKQEERQNDKGKTWGKQMALVKRGRVVVEDKVRKQAVLM